MSESFADLPRGHFGAILADPPWRFRSWSETNQYRAPSKHYALLRTDEICALPVGDLAADDCVLFLWISWPLLKESLRTIEAWGFEYKTCAFCWVKAHARQIEMFQDDTRPHIALGYWTRANSEVCLLATRGHPKRLAADIKQAIIEPRREHSRKPDGIHERIERLVAGPYLELFARQKRPNWTVWGNETDKFNPVDDVWASYKECLSEVRERQANGGPKWEPK